MRCIQADVVFGQCLNTTSQVFYVNRVPGSWPACPRHSRTVLRDLMGQFPGRGVYTRRGVR